LGIGGYPIAGPVAEVYVHHYNSGIQPERTVAGAMARMRNAQQYHADVNGWGDIGYSWCVDDLGNIYEARGWWRTGAHTLGYNSKGYGICWLGDSGTAPPSSAALAGIALCIANGIAVGAIAPGPTVVAHRDRVPDTACCGDPLYARLDEIRALVLNGGQGENDMDSTQNAMLVALAGAQATPYPPFGRPANSGDVLEAIGAAEARTKAEIAALAQRVGAVEAGQLPPAREIADELAGALLRQLGVASTGK